MSNYNFKCKKCGVPLIETEWCGYLRHDRRFKNRCRLDKGEIRK